MLEPVESPCQDFLCTPAEKIPYSCYNANMDAFTPSSRPHRTFAISLILDAPSSQKIRLLRQKIAEAAGSDAEADAPPHITLGMFHADEGNLDEVKRFFGDFSNNAQKAFRVDFAGIDFFKDKVIFLSLKKDAESFSKIAELNNLAHRTFLPEFEAGANRDYLPENFFPHLTLASKLAKGGFGKARDCCASMPLPHSARIVGASLFLCRPYSEIACFDFTQGASAQGE